LTSSSLELLDNLEESMEYKEVVLNESVIKGMFPNQRDDIKRNVALVNQAWRTSGTALRACAFTLNEIKENTPKGNWNALLESGDLDFSKAVAQDLVAAHSWLASSSIPDRFLANISARTLGTVARIKDPAIKLKVTEKIVETEGKGFPESDLKKMLKIRPKIKKGTASKAAKKGLAEDASKEDTIVYYTKIVDDMQASLDKSAAQLKKAVLANQDKAGEIAKLKEQIKDLKAA
jgi:hypothetical protein